jgi:hypothetical protein
MCARWFSAHAASGEGHKRNPSTARTSSRDHHTIQDQRRGHRRVCQRTLAMPPLGAEAWQIRRCCVPCHPRCIKHPKNNRAGNETDLARYG